MLSKNLKAVHILCLQEIAISPGENLQCFGKFLNTFQSFPHFHFRRVVTSVKKIILLEFLLLYIVFKNSSTYLYFVSNVGK